MKMKEKDLDCSDSQNMRKLKESEKLKQHNKNQKE